MYLLDESYNELSQAFAQSCPDLNVRVSVVRPCTVSDALVRFKGLT